MVKPHNYLIDCIDWNTMLDQSKVGRWAGSHIDQMSKIFPHSKVIASDTQGDYQGSDCIVILFTPPNPDGTPYIIIMHDSYGSCSGCDAWEDTSDEELTHLVKSIVGDSKVFTTLDEAIEYLEQDTENWFLIQFKNAILKQLKEVEI